MNYDDVVAAGTSLNNKPDWKNLILKPFICGMIFGVGYYAASLIIRSPIGNELVLVAKS